MAQWDAYYQMTAYDTGLTTEDGDPVIGEAFQVLVEDETGRRQEHNVTFASPYRSTFDACKAKAGRLVDRVNAAIRSGTWSGPENSPCWHEVEPSYGSAAYARNWREYARDSMDDEERDGHDRMGT